MKGYIYILQSLKNQRFYIGSTNDLERRVVEHNKSIKIIKNKGEYLSFSQRLIGLWLRLEQSEISDGSEISPAVAV
jgi:hypothetical protein